MNYKDYSHLAISRIKNKIMFFRQNKHNFDLILASFAFLGIIGGFVLVYDGRRLPRTAQPVTAPAASVYKNFIAGSGIVESGSENIQLGTLAGGIVDKVHVKVGDKVKTGAPLFTLDKRQAEADVVTQEAVVEKARASLKQAEASLKDARDKFNLARNIPDRRAISRQDFLTFENTYLIAKSAVTAAQADLKTAEATLARNVINLDLLTVKAPLDCEVLQRNVRPGEFAPTGSLATPLMLLGSVDEIHVRINVDENEAWRFAPGSPAVAYLKGNSAFKFDLVFDHLEPFVLPKTSLTGNSSERVDVRVLQPIYKFRKKPASVYIGQQVDVFIEVPESLSFEAVARRQGDKT
jgi:RND family efflux transporter MFP subunit